MVYDSQPATSNDKIHLFALNGWTILFQPQYGFPYHARLNDEIQGQLTHGPESPDWRA